MNKFVICLCCGQWLKIQDIDYYTYAFPMSLNERDAMIGMNTHDFFTHYYQPPNSQLAQCVLNKEQNDV